MTSSPLQLETKSPSSHPSVEAEIMKFTEITESPLQLEKYIDSVRSPRAGAISTFIGTTRNEFQGREVIRLEYEAYTAMAYKELNKICDYITTNWKTIGVAIAHRVGLVPVGEESVIVVVSAPHRKDSLEAVEYAINTVKERVPIWKKEFYASDNFEAEWKQNCESCTSHGHHL